MIDAGESHPPRLPSVAAWLSVIAATVFAVLFPKSVDAWWHWAGWVCGAVVTVVCLGCYRLVDQRRRQRPNYFRPQLAGLVLYVAVAAGVGVGMFHAYLVAQWYFG